jgi:hypothetical protein
MMEHTRRCREYRELYKEKLLAKKGMLPPDLLPRLDQLEHQLDIFNIGINRERAEAAADARKKVFPSVDVSHLLGRFLLSSSHLLLVPFVEKIVISVKT